MNPPEYYTFICRETEIHFDNEKCYNVDSPINKMSLLRFFNEGLDLNILIPWEAKEQFLVYEDPSEELANHLKNNGVELFEYEVSEYNIADEHAEFKTTDLKKLKLHKTFYGGRTQLFLTAGQSNDITEFDNWSKKLKLKTAKDKQIRLKWKGTTDDGLPPKEFIKTQKDYDSNYGCSVVLLIIISTLTWFYL